MSIFPVLWLPVDTGLLDECKHSSLFREYTTAAACQWWSVPKSRNWPTPHQMSSRYLKQPAGSSLSFHGEILTWNSGSTAAWTFPRFLLYTALVHSKSLQNWPNWKHLLIVSPLTLTGSSAPKDRLHSIEGCHALSPTRRQRSATSEQEKNPGQECLWRKIRSVSEFSERNQTYQCKNEANKGPGAWEAAWSFLGRKHNTTNLKLKSTYNIWLPSFWTSLPTSGATTFSP